MGGGQSIAAPAPEPLEFTKSSSASLPKAYRHLCHFPVLAKQARGPIRHHPNERITHFLKEQDATALLIADYLSVRERLVFLQTHKVGLPPKHLKHLLFSGPSREVKFLYSPATTAMVEGKHPVSSSFNNNLKEAKTEIYATNNFGNTFQFEIRYRGSFLSRAVPLSLVSTALHRVIRSWMDDTLRKRGFSILLTMVNKLLSVFRPTEEVWYTIINSFGKDGTTLLTYACSSRDTPLSVIEKLLQIPCFDLALPDHKFGLNAIQLAHMYDRQDVLAHFASLVGLQR